MATPKGLRNKSFNLSSGGQVMIYSNPDHIFLQLRKEIPTEADILNPSFKVALSLTPIEALNLASELLQTAAQRLNEDYKDQNKENDTKANL